LVPATSIRANCNRWIVCICLDLGYDFLIMQIVIALHYYVNDVKTLQQGEFRVNLKNYREDPNKEAARIAYEWLRKVRRELIYRVIFYKALYDGIDITEEVKQWDQQLNREDDFNG